MSATPAERAASHPSGLRPFPPSSPQRHLFGDAINGTALDDRGEDARTATLAERAAADELSALTDEMGLYDG